MLIPSRRRGAPNLVVSFRTACGEGICVGPDRPAPRALFRYSGKSQAAPAVSHGRARPCSANTHEGLMDTEQRYTANAPTRAEVDALGGATVIEFGANWCGICAGAQPAIVASFSAHPAVRHLKIEDGPGRPLGRSFGVKLWPTLVFLRDGVEVARVVRPADAKQIEADGFAALA
jgi:thioredoxin 1